MKQFVLVLKPGPITAQPDEGHRGFSGQGDNMNSRTIQNASNISAVRLRA